MKAIHKKVLAISLSAMLIPAAISSAFAHSEHRHNMQHGAYKMLKKLDLTDAQKEDVKAIFKAKRSEAGSQRESFKALLQSLGEQIKQDTWDETQVAQLVADMHKFKSQQMEKRLATKQDVWLILTPQQQAKYIEMLEKRLAKMSGKSDERMEKRQAKIMKKLELTQEQETVVAPLLAQLSENKGQLKSIKMAAKSQEVALLSASGTYDQMSPLTSEQEQAIQQLSVNNASLHHRIWHNLTAEQQSTFERFMKQNKKGKKRGKSRQS
ncbi:Spy/CpxP family protein refolding chaperone [Thalassotalea eurytherma]|uniref:Periplasmic heavy metal sensor n=1 Tax=Thalassotalea eurytherma TaxID=1144278 RepID=A0ABQ6H588_9GAMM|nr:Spy/CpxP family protein refolding chaperone [Thalassotalea eurytherma]GLX83313.1 hypothetical protein theurythT_27650 [Thalassotalea eurytherma]